MKTLITNTDQTGLKRSVPWAGEKWMFYPCSAEYEKRSIKAFRKYPMVSTEQRGRKILRHKGYHEPEDSTIFYGKSPCGPFTAQDNILSWLH